MITPVPQSEIDKLKVLAAHGRHFDVLKRGEQLFGAHLHTPAFYETLGLASAALGDFNQAFQLFEALARFSPGDWSAAYNAGRALEDLRRYDEAAGFYETAQRLDPLNPQIPNNLGNVLTELGRYREARAAFEAALDLAPDYAEAHNNLGAVHMRLAERKAAKACFDKALELRTDYADAHCNRALVNLIEGRLDQGFAENEWRKRADNPRGARLMERSNFAVAEIKPGERVFLHWEQGFGDTLQFVRYVQRVRALGAEVTLSVQPPLIRLIRTWEPEIEVVGPVETPQAFAGHAPVMSLPLVFGTTLETIPEPPKDWGVDPALAAAWSKRLGPRRRPRVGLVWCGNPRYRADRIRSIDFARISPLLAADVDWVSLQKEVPEPEAPAFAASRVLDVSDGLTDFAETAALISQLDVVVSVDTSVAHLAGSLGKPVWILLPFAPDWRWLTEREDSPWYPSARLFRQKTLGDWAGVVARVKAELDRLGG